MLVGVNLKQVPEYRDGTDNITFIMFPPVRGACAFHKCVKCTFLLVYQMMILPRHCNLSYLPNNYARIDRPDQI
jgi:hypothetical protein